METNEIPVLDEYSAASLHPELINSNYLEEGDHFEKTKEAIHHQDDDKEFDHEKIYQHH